jgi:hypothetical protein
MSPEQLAELSENIRYIREKTDETGEKLGEFRISVEHRLTKVEVMSSVWGSLSGLLGGLLAGLGLHFKGR